MRPLTCKSGAACLATGVLVGVLLQPLTGAGGGADRPTVSAPAPRGQTDPVPHGGDAADDPAIWAHPDDPAKSLILGTDKQGGLHVYDLDGGNLQTVADGALPNNVDVVYGFRLG